MRNKKSVLAVMVAFIFMVALYIPSVIAADVEIKGEVGQNGKIMSEDGDEFTIANDDLGEKVMENEAGKIIKATGAVSEKGGKKTIKIKSYTVEGSASGG